MNIDQRDKALAVHARLLGYYGYPEWRDPLPALDELVSTILSQNTNDGRARTMRPSASLR